MGSKQLMCVNGQTFSSSKMSQMQVPEKRRFLLFCILASTILVSGTFFIGSAIIATNNKETVAGLIPINATMIAGINATKIAGEKVCQARCRLDEGEALPRGIVSRTSELEMRSLRGPLIREKKQGTSTNLLAIAAGIKQKESVNKIVTKFLLSDFVIMIFHYDGNVDDWRDLEWSSQAIHISAMDQTKWWFAKRFLHPDIISEYDYIFIWDEDIGVENFDVGRYLSIIKEEGLQISQPALDPNNSVVHHLFTLQDSASKVHRRIPDHLGVRKCDGNRTGPPCSGWVEIMVPVFSKTAWRCAWLLIQNDLIHGWGFDELLGYCIKGDRTQNIGIVDQEYVAHQAVPSLGDSHKNQMNPQVPDSQVQAPPVPTQHWEREEVMKRCFLELRMFRRRWQKAIYEDECWVDPY